MRYLEIELIGFKRFMLNNINHFLYKPSSPIQLIIGTNGSGKTSLINEISPLPGSSDAFEKEGSKRVLFTHNGSTYELKNYFGTTGTKHSFVKDGGENLNPGGTLPVQKKLILQEFGIDNEKQALLSGQINFTDLSPSERREWFTKLADTSYDYAIGLYNRLNERKRDISGALKLAKKRMVTETSKLIDSKEKEIIIKEVDDFHTLLNRLMEYRKPVEFNAGELEHREFEIAGMLEVMSRTLIQKRTKLSFKGIKSLEELESKINDLKNDLVVHGRLNDKLFDDFNKIKESLDIIKNAGTVNTKDIKENIARLSLKQAELRLNRRLIVAPISNASEAYTAFDTIYLTLESHLHELPNNKERLFNFTTRDSNKEQLYLYKDKLATTDNLILKYTTQKKHQEEHQTLGQTKCPNCSHSWNIGFNQLIYQDALDKLEKLKTERVEYLALVEKHEKFDNEVNDYLNKYKNIIGITNTWTILKPLWDELLNSKVILDDPLQAVRICQEFLTELKFEVECERIQKEIDEYNKQHKLLESVENYDIEKLQNQSNAIEKEIQDKTILISNIKNELNVYTSLLSEIRSINKTQDNINELYNEIKIVNTNLIETIQRTSLLQAIKEVQSLLAVSESKLNFINLQKSMIDDLATQITQLERDEEIMKILVTELSPTSGLIAENLMWFIKVFVAQMNSFIKKIWSYPLIIQPCKIDEENKVDLDYKFPVMIQNKDNIIPDVKVGSKGMLKIFNLAFQLTAIKFQGLSDNPLFLDEWSSGLDDSHRVTSVAVINSLMDEKMFQQCFTINHYYAEYGSLVNAQLCVLNKDNVVIPSGIEYNKHVLMQ